MNRLRHQKHKHKNTETKYLNNIKEDRILKVKNNLLKLTKELNDRELRVREIQTRKEIEEPFLKPINASIDGKKVIKVPFTRNTWRNWLIKYNYIYFQGHKKRFVLLKAKLLVFF